MAIVSNTFLTYSAKGIREDLEQCDNKYLTGRNSIHEQYWPRKRV
jgi:hypothetical protein